MSKIKGTDLMLFVDNKAIAYATNHTLTVNAETVSTANKDQSSGDWDVQEVNALSWEVSSENLFSTDGNGNDFADLFDLMVAKTPITAVFALKSEQATEVPQGGWTPTFPKYTGNIVITNLQLNAPVNEFATFTMSAQGVGALTKSASV